MIKFYFVTCLLLFQVTGDFLYAQEEKKSKGVCLDSAEYEQTIPLIDCTDPWELLSEASDEFDGTSIDLSKWDYFPGWGHVFNLGNANDCFYQTGVDGANGDLAYYTFGNNHEVSNGTLKLFIKEENLTADCSIFFSQKDSGNHDIRIGSDFVVAPILHFSDNRIFNAASGLLFHINVNNIIVFKIGALYHIKPYSVIDDKAFSPEVKTTFNYFQKCFQLDVLLRKKKKSQLFFSLGGLGGKGIYKEGVEHNYSIDYMNGENFNLKLGFGYKYQLAKNFYISVEPCFIWFTNKVQSEYYEFGPSPYAYLVKLIGTNSQSSLFTMISISYDYFNLKTIRK